MMNEIRTLPKMVHHASRVAVKRAKSSTPAPRTAVANLGYTKAQLERINAIQLEMR